MSTEALTGVALLVVVGLFLPGCGGGGGGGGSGPQNQSISFANPGPISTTVASEITGVPQIQNVASGGAGTGAITYSSDDPDVASVDSTGTVEVGIAGATRITATKAASSGFNSASASYVINVARAGPTITFDNPGPLDQLVGAQFVNPAALDAGEPDAIVYDSSDTSVATVDADLGELTAVGAGSAVITATRPQDERFEAATASYTLNVLRSATASAWVGIDDSEVVFPEAAGGAGYLRSTDRDCNIDQISSCSSGQEDRLSGLQGSTVPVLDSTMNLPVNGLDNLRSGYQYLRSGSFTSGRVLAGSSRFSPRIGHGAVFFDDRLWVMAGGTAAADTNAEVWASDDGSTWELITDAAAFGPNWFNRWYAFNGKLWTISNFFVWSSTDGRQWSIENATGLPAISAVTHLTTVVADSGVWLVHDGNSYLSEDGVTWTQTNTVPGAAGGSGRQFATLTWFQPDTPGSQPHLYLIGGSVGGVTENSIWRSPDGITWTSVASVPFAPRAQHTSFVLDGKLWVLGGLNTLGAQEAASLGDTWSTTDGIHWTEETNTHLLDRSYLSKAVVADGKVHLIGGVKTGFFNQVFESDDGIEWTERSPYADFTPRLAPRTVVFNNALWLIGGRDHLHNATNEIWRSTDGVNWAQETPQGASFPPRSSHGVTVFNDRLWVVGGWDGFLAAGGTETPDNQVWSSADGVSWTQHDSTGPIFSPRYAHQLVEFDGRLWVFGGIDGNGSALADVWSTADGETWVQETATTAIGPRGNHQVVVFNGSLWSFGGTDGPATYNDTWTSANGVDWTNVVPMQPSMLSRQGHQAVVYNGRMWVIGGASLADYFAGTRMNDVWSTTDGVTWTEETASAAFGPRWLHNVVVYDNAMWLLAGADLELKNDVWRSTDGVNWRLGVALDFEL